MRRSPFEKRGSAYQSDAGVGAGPGEGPAALAGDLQPFLDQALALLSGDVGVGVRAGARQIGDGNDEGLVVIGPFDDHRIARVVHVTFLSVVALNPGLMRWQSPGGSTLGSLDQYSPASSAMRTMRGVNLPMTSTSSSWAAMMASMSL